MLLNVWTFPTLIALALGFFVLLAFREYLRRLANKNK
jgi:hypothetical protein